MKYDTAAGRKASLVDFLKVYFSDKKGGGEERIEDKEVRSSKGDEDDNYNNYISNYNNNFNRSKYCGPSNTITLADLLPKRKNI